MHNAVFIEKDINRGFKSIGISFWDLNFVISKLNVYFCMSIIFYISFRFQSPMGVVNIKNWKINTFVILFD